MKTPKNKKTFNKKKGKNINKTMFKKDLKAKKSRKKNNPQILNANTPGKEDDNNIKNKEKEKEKNNDKEKNKIIDDVLDI